MMWYFKPILLVGLVYSRFIFSEDLPSIQFSHQVIHENQALSARRIIEFSKDQEWDLVISQGKRFFKEFPQSELQDSVRLVMGHAYLAKGMYQDALDSYEVISKSCYQDAAYRYYVEALFLLQRYEEVISYVEERESSFQQDDSTFYYYGASCFYLSQKAQGDFQEKLCKKSVQSFQKLSSEGFYYQKSLLMKASLEALLGDYKTAIESYHQAEMYYPEVIEDIRFQKARCYGYFDQEKAFLEFKNIVEKDSKRRIDAYFRYLELAYSLQKWDTIVEMYPQFKSQFQTFSKERHLYIFAYSFFQKKSYKESVEILRPFVFEMQSGFDFDSAYLLLLSSYQLSHDLDVCSCADFILSHAFDLKEDQYLEIRYLKAISLYHLKKYSESLEELNILSSKGSSFSKEEDVIFIKADVLFRLNRFQESQEVFRSYVFQYPSGRYQDLSRHYFLKISSLLFKPSQEDVLLQTKLTQDLEAFLALNCLKDKEEKLDFSFTLAKFYYEQKLYEKSLTLLRGLLQEGVSQDRTYEIHFLSSLCYWNLENQMGLFIFHAEQCLLLNPKFSQAAQLHYRLASVLLEQSKSIPEGKLLEEKAFIHFYDSWVLNPSLFDCKELKKAATYFYSSFKSRLNYSEFKPEFQNILVMGLNLYEGFFKEVAPKGVDQNNILSFERELYEYGFLLQFSKNRENLLSFLESVDFAYRDLNTDSCYRQELQTSLANVYFEKNDARARSLYEELIKKFPLKSSPCYHKALVNLARLYYRDIEQNHTDSSELKETIPVFLKDVQLYKDFRYEPLYLEASLDYAAFFSHLYFQDSLERIDKEIFLLKRGKEEFYRCDDIQSRGYNEQKKMYPDKEKICNYYLLLIEGKIQFLMASKALLESNYIDSQKYKESALNILEALQKDKEKVSSYFSLSIDRSLEELKSF